MHYVQNEKKLVPAWLLGISANLNENECYSFQAVANISGKMIFPEYSQPYLAVLGIVTNNTFKMVSLHNTRTGLSYLDVSY